MPLGVIDITEYEIRDHSKVTCIGIYAVMTIQVRTLHVRKLSKISDIDPSHFQPRS